MARGFFVTATDTGVGKTVLTAALAKYWRKKGVNAGVMKPAQSGAETVSDGELLVKFAGVDDPWEDVVPYSFREPLAPAVAARLEGVEVRKEIILERFRKLEGRHELMLVEGAGGLMVPLSEDTLVAHLARDLGLPLLVVARPNLGTINHTLLTVAAARQIGLEVAGIVINGYRDRGDYGEKTNPGLIEYWSQIPILGIIPHLAADSTEEVISLLADRLSEYLNLSLLQRWL
ncbi:dethiobiotin synthase [Calderihabitans maritimus]|uniref:ATP-dependent dethiobiotin synthetase BioD n=1 Tax=Calderihabitans maritimus TaxID=1246530 RepID=A0A1Z5HX33_9FIRM|nr:dethiobiotin synthase [Calderihabitans maritimus]GAW94086.1 dithiobiotin synthetase [Calderihabitans maritimus]